MNMKLIPFAILTIAVLLLSSCSSTDSGEAQDLAGQAIGDAIPANPPANFFCAFALIGPKHDKLCAEGNPDANNNPQYAVDDVAQPRQADSVLFLRSSGTPSTNSGSTENNGRDGAVEVIVFPDTDVNSIPASTTNANGENLADVINKIRVTLEKPASPANIRYPVFRKAFYSTNFRDAQGQRTYREIDLGNAMGAIGANNMNLFDTLLPANDPNNPNSLWFDLAEATGNLELSIDVSDNLVASNEIAVAPEETHVVMFTCRCDNTNDGCRQQAGWVCNPRYQVPGTGEHRTFGDGDVRYLLSKVLVRQHNPGSGIAPPGTVQN